MLERRIQTVDERLVLLAPPGADIPAHFVNVTVDPERHDRHLREMQRLRAAIYVADGAVSPDQLSGAGLHETPEDGKSWHLLMFRPGRELTSCVWYLHHENPAGVGELRVRECPLNADPHWRESLTEAITSELRRAQQDRLGYAEVGGWAVARERRSTSEGLLLALAAYSLGRVLGGALGVTTATVRHASATILKRLGGSPLEGNGRILPPYFDEKYRCFMELLRFDSRQPHPRFGSLIELLGHQLAQVEVVAAHMVGTPHHYLPEPLAETP